MTHHDDRRLSSLHSSDHQEFASGKDAAPLVLSGVSALSGAIVGILLAGNGYASIGLIAAALAAGWIGWWARGLL